MVIGSGRRKLDDEGDAPDAPATKPSVFQSVSENAECKAARSDERGVSSDTPQRGATKPTQQSALSDIA